MKKSTRNIPLVYLPLLISLGILLLAFHPVKAQSPGNTRVSLSLPKSSLKEALSRIEKESGVLFVYNETLLKKHTTDAISVADRPVLSLLNELLRSTDLDYKVQNDKIVIVEKEVKPADRNAKAQRIVEGQVKGEEGRLLEGVTVREKGRSKGVVTGRDGSFKLSVSPAGSMIVFTAVGYLTREVELSSAASLDVQLEINYSKLEETIVVGYGTQKKSQLVGAVSKINAAEVNRVPVASFDAQLQGKATGLQINNNAGIPGEAVFVRVRGTTSINSSNDPLYIVDGVFINNTSLQTINTGGRKTSPLVDINPTDIESVEVLKDASATAIYGARGANGVVIISTKRGTYNTKPKITLNASLGEGWATRLWKLSDGPTTAQAVNDNYINTQTDRGVNYDVAYAKRPFRPVAEGGRGNPEDQGTYDRIGPVMRRARLQEYDISVQGGSAATKYYIGAAYTDQEAVIKPADFRRASLKVNLDQKINDRVTIGVSNAISRSFRNQVTAGDGTTAGPILSAPTVGQATYDPLYNADGTPFITGTNRENVIYILEDNDKKTTSTRYLGNLYAEAELFRNIRFRSSLGIDYNLYDEKSFFTSRLLEGAGGGKAYSALTQNSTWTNEQTLSYNNRSSLHNIGVLIGNSVQSNTLKLTAATGIGFPNDNYKIISAASTFVSTESWSKSSLASFFSRINYSYLGKYFLEASIRADASSRFGANNKWGYFPAVGASWRIKQEGFLKDNTTISNLKLRASYGITGNQNGINDFASLGLWEGGYNYANNETATSYAAGTGPRQLSNPNLKWEKTRQINAGVELGLFRDRIALEFNVYSKYTTDALLQLPIAQQTGFQTYTSNAGEISNRGLELGINTTNIGKRDFTWTTNFNISRNVNKVEKLPVPVTYYSRDWIRLQEGYPMYSFWLYKHLYVDPATGNAVYEDVNKDGQITVADRQILGNAQPDFFGGLTNTVSYKGIDLSVLFTYQWGNKIWSLTRFFSMYGGTREGRSLHKVDEDYWKQPGDISDYPRYTSEGNNWGLQENSRSMEDASFLRLKSVTVGYTIPKKVTSKLNVESIRFYLTGSNLWLLTSYSGPDPESNTSNASQMIQGIDLGTPPQPNSVQFGINLIF